MLSSQPNIEVRILKIKGLELLYSVLHHEQLFVDRFFFLFVMGSTMHIL